MSILFGVLRPSLPPSPAKIFGSCYCYNVIQCSYMVYDEQQKYILPTWIDR